MPELAIGLDLGTTSTAAVAIDEQGEVVSWANRRHSADSKSARPEQAEQCPQRHWHCAIEVLRQIADNLPGTPACLGITGQMHGVLVCDHRQEPLTQLVTWQDRRVLGRDTHGQSTFERAQQRVPHAEQETGCRLSPGYGSLTLSDPSLHALITKHDSFAATLADWIASRLAAIQPVTDRSNAASWGIYDFTTDQWHGALLSALELPESCLPEVRDSGTRVGELAPEWAAETGLPSGLPIGCPIGDNQAAILASTWGHSAFVQINIGTGGQIAWPIPEFKFTPGLETRYLPIDRFINVGAGVSGGDAYAWVARTIQSWLSDFGVSRDLPEILTRLNELTRDAQPTPDGLQCRPTFRGTRQHPEWRGEILGITPTNLKVGQLGRATLQGIVDGLASFVDGPASLPKGKTTLRLATGNAIRENPILAQILDRQFGPGLLTPCFREEAAVGVALLVGAEHGLWQFESQLVRLQPLIAQSSERPTE